jgi:hypothetical protein
MSEMVAVNWHPHSCGVWDCGGMLTNSEALTKLKHEAYLALKEQGLPIPHDLRVEFEGTGDHQ